MRVSSSLVWAPHYISNLSKFSIGVVVFLSPNCPYGVTLDVVLWWKVLLVVGFLGRCLVFGSFSYSAPTLKVVEPCVFLELVHFSYSDRFSLALPDFAYVLPCNIRSVSVFCGFTGWYCFRYYFVSSFSIYPITSCGWCFCIRYLLLNLFHSYCVSVDLLRQFLCSVSSIGRLCTWLHISSGFVPFSLLTCSLLYFYDSILFRWFMFWLPSTFPCLYYMQHLRPCVLPMGLG